MYKVFVHKYNSIKQNVLIVFTNTMIETKCPWTNKSFGGKGVEGEVPGSGDEPSARGWISGGDGGGGVAMLDACYYGAEQRLERRSGAKAGDG